MGIKDIKSEARRKLGINMHQAIIVGAIKYTLYVTLIALIVMSCLSLGSVHTVAGIVMICYSSVLLVMACICGGIINYAMVDFYLASYKCKPYNIRRMGETLARSGVSKVFMLNLKRASLAILLLLCLIVPGVIYLVRTSMAAHLLIANPKMKAKTALSASNKVMSGKTGAYFSLMASLTGWWLLGVGTLGLGFVFILPYTNLCKMEYYKRNLQGDKAAYQVPLQPVSPAMSVPEPAVNVRQIRQDGAEQTARPIQMDTPIPPMDTLGAEDMAEMNAAMRDVGGADVQEVVIPTVGKTKNGIPLDPISNESKHAIDDSDLVEIVKPLTTREMSDADMMGKKINRMFSHSDPQDEVKDQNYVSHMSSQSPDDFITHDFDEEPVVPDVPAEPAKNDAAAEPVPEPVMNDKEFAEFIRTFEAESQSMAAADSAPVVEQVSPAAEPAKPAAEPVRPAATGRPAATPGAGFGTATGRPAATGRPNAVNPGLHGSSRMDKLRQEREERMKNGGK